MEYAPSNKRGLYAAFPQLGPAIAFALSSGTFLLINRVVGETSPAFVGGLFQLAYGTLRDATHIVEVARTGEPVFLEGGPTLARAFLTAGLVDEVVAYVAPMLLGAGRPAVGDLGIETIADALHLDVTDVCVLGTGTETNVRLTMSPQRKRLPPSFMMSPASCWSWLAAMPHMRSGVS